MTLDQMNEEERLALAGLLRMMVGLDGAFTPDESAALKDVAVELGEGPFWKLLESFDGRKHGDVRALARQVTRKEVQELIYGLLYGVAITQTITSRENELLEWLASTWQVEVSEVSEVSD
jgi:hypothetical protein